tara:strand:- start:10422 stop:11045 length:624 start_codon:yes stop_codon:yes gene_type:complete
MTLYTKDNFRELFDVTDDVFAQIELYQTLLVKWNKAINLVSPKTINESWHRHVIDSAQMVRFVPDQTKIYADLGCGGGFPGLVVALMRPDIETHLVESDERKGQFMRTVVRETGAQNVTIHTKRVEDVTGDFTPDFVTARALASLDKLFDYCLPWVEQNPEMIFCFMKGGRAEEEIALARKTYKFDVQSHPSITDSEAKILTVHHYV